ncbi:hypothetical protein QTP86_020579, partial [Hemibagrus guttatus]
LLPQLPLTLIPVWSHFGHFLKVPGSLKMKRTENAIYA